MLCVLGPEKPKPAKAKLLRIKLTALLFVRNLVLFSILINKLLVSIIAYETKIYQVSFTLASFWSKAKLLLFSETSTKV